MYCDSTGLFLFVHAGPAHLHVHKNLYQHKTNVQHEIEQDSQNNLFMTQFYGLLEIPNQFRERNSTNLRNSRFYFDFV